MANPPMPPNPFPGVMGPVQGEVNQIAGLIQHPFNACFGFANGAIGWAGNVANFVVTTPARILGGLNRGGGY